jgi:thiol-disulfide isomerase/thioredoxin
MSRNKIVIAALFAAGLAVAAFLYHKYRVAPEVAFNALQLEDLNGRAVDLQSFRDKDLILNFFATWCGPCVREMPELQKTADSLLSNNYVLLCISDEPSESLRNFSDRMSLHVRILHSIKPLKELKIFTYPTSYAFNLKREVVFKKVGDIDWSDAQVIAALRNVAH